MSENAVVEKLRDGPKPERAVLAEQYFEEDLNGQRRWYSDRASRLSVRPERV